MADCIPIEGKHSILILLSKEHMNKQPALLRVPHLYSVNFLKLTLELKLILSLGTTLLLLTCFKSVASCSQAPCLLDLLLNCVELLMHLLLLVQ